MFIRGLLFFIISFLGIAASYSCSCHNDIEEMNMARYNDAALIFSGKVDSIGACTEVKTVKFLPTKFYKGSHTGSILVKDIICTGSCAFAFEKDQQYLIYLHTDNQGNYKILPCGGTRLILSEKEIQDQLIQAERFKTTEYLKKEVEKWKHEEDLLVNVSKVENGKVQTLYMNGKSTAEGRFKNGLPEGEWKYYYPDGNLKSVGYYKNGKKTGYWVEYTIYFSSFEDTSSVRKKYLIRSSGHYESGFKNGKWEKVNLDGSVQTLFYRKGKFVSEKSP